MDAFSTVYMTSGLKTGRPVLNPDKMTKEDVNVKEICPAAQGAKNHQPASYDPRTKLFYVGTNHICMDYQAFGVKYKGGFPYVGAILSMYPADHGNTRGRLIAYDPIAGQAKWSGNKAFQLLRVAQEIPSKRRFLPDRAVERHQVRPAGRSTFETTAPASGVPTIGYDDLV